MYWVVVYLWRRSQLECTGFRSLPFYPHVYNPCRLLNKRFLRDLIYQTTIFQNPVVLKFIFARNVAGKRSIRTIGGLSSPLLMNNCLFTLSSGQDCALYTLYCGYQLCQHLMIVTSTIQMHLIVSLTLLGNLKITSLLILSIVGLK